jgi:hypothetical protein
MLIEDFVLLVDRRKSERPVWFGLDSDPPATTDQIEHAESALGVRLPKAYLSFVTIYGGGYFALGNVFSVCPGSDWNIIDRNHNIQTHDFLAISDNGVGDLYGFRVENDICNEKIVLFDHETKSYSQTNFADIFDFLIGTALNPR